MWDLVGPAQAGQNGVVGDEQAGALDGGDDVLQRRVRNGDPIMCAGALGEGKGSVAGVRVHGCWAYTECTAVLGVLVVKGSSE